MDEESVCRKCGLPKENGSEVCACEEGSSSRPYLSSTGHTRLSRARMFSSGRRGAETSKIDVEEVETFGDHNSETEFSESRDEEVPVDANEVSECMDEDAMEERVRVSNLDTILTDYAVKEEPGSETEEQSNESTPFLVKKETLRIGRSGSRIRSYVEGFDEAVGGGIPEGSVVLISGSAGAMKSSLAYYILYTNVLARGLKCLYVTLEQPINSLLNQMDALGMNVEPIGRSISLFDVGFLRKETEEPGKDWFELFMGNISNVHNKKGFDLLVIDSLEALEVIACFKNRREELFRLFEWLRDLNATTFIITERTDCPFGRHLNHFRNEEEFLSDGIINLALHPIGEIDVQRRIRCVKMRGTKHEAGYLSLMWDDGKFKVTKAVGR